jgi:hypothetical protein
MSYDDYYHFFIIIIIIVIIITNTIWRPVWVIYSFYIDIIS